MIPDHEVSFAAASDLDVVVVVVAVVVTTLPKYGIELALIASAFCIEVFHRLCSKVQNLLLTSLATQQPSIPVASSLLALTARFGYAQFDAHRTRGWWRTGRGGSFWRLDILRDGIGERFFWEEGYWLNVEL